MGRSLNSLWNLTAKQKAKEDSGKCAYCRPHAGCNRKHRPERKRKGSPRV